MKNIQKTVRNVNTPGAYDWDTENENDINLSLRDANFKKHPSDVDLWSAGSLRLSPNLSSVVERLMTMKSKQRGCLLYGGYPIFNLRIIAEIYKIRSNSIGDLVTMTKNLRNYYMCKMGHV